MTSKLLIIVVVRADAEELAVTARSMFVEKSAACSATSANGNIFNALFDCVGNDGPQPALPPPHLVDRICFGV